jgi:uncharacterized membrane protein
VTVFLTEARMFAALTAVFAKIGVENVNSDFATFIRTIVILMTAALNRAPTLIGPHLMVSCS